MVATARGSRPTYQACGLHVPLASIFVMKADFEADPRARNAVPPDKQSRANFTGWRNPWIPRLPAAIVLLALMAMQAGRVEGLAPTLLYLSGWVIVPHVSVGVWVFVRFFKAYDTTHTVLDALAFVFFILGLTAFHSPFAWCAWFGLVFSLAMLKYVLVSRDPHPLRLKQYALMKLRIEAPAVVCFFLLALIAWLQPDFTVLHVLIASGVFVSSTLFALWMIAYKRVYQKLAEDMGATTSGSPPEQ